MKEKIKSLFLKLWASVTGTSVALYRFLEPILKDNAAQILEKLAPLALGIVAAYAASPKSGEDKLKGATEELKVAAIGAGITAGTAVIQTAIQLALLNLRSKEDAK
jgi:hypothetical protein